MTDESTWDAVGGSSLLLVAEGESDEAVASLFADLRGLLSTHSIRIERGTEFAVDAVRWGIESLPWIRGDRVFVLRCPATLPVAEASSLAFAASSPTGPNSERGVRILLEIAARMLRTSHGASFVVAHEWRVGDAVRFESGSIAEFDAFVRSPLAWSTTYLGRGSQFTVRVENEFPFWFRVVRSERNAADPS